MPEVDLITDYLDYLKNTKKTASNTLAAYSRDLNSFREFLDAKKLTVSSATSSTVAKYKDCLATNGKSVATVSRCVSCLRSFYKYLVVYILQELLKMIKLKRSFSKFDLRTK